MCGYIPDFHIDVEDGVAGRASPCQQAHRIGKFARGAMDPGAREAMKSRMRPCRRQQDSVDFAIGPSKLASLTYRTGTDIDISANPP